MTDCGYSEKREPDLRAQLRQAQEERDEWKRLADFAVPRMEAAEDCVRVALGLFDGIHAERDAAIERAKAAEKDAAEQRALVEELKDKGGTLIAALDIVPPYECRGSPCPHHDFLDALALTPAEALARRGGDPRDPNP